MEPNGERTGTGNVVLVSVISSLVTSLVTCAIVLLVALPPRGQEPPEKTGSGPESWGQHRQENIAGVSKHELFAVPVPRVRKPKPVARAKVVPAKPDAVAVASRAKPRTRLLARLEALRAGVSEKTIRDTLIAVLDQGEGVVPEVVALLESGTDVDYGHRLKTRGRLVESYPRLRTALFDALRLIHTDETKRGLLAEIPQVGSLADYRDLLRLFADTDDREIEGAINDIVPRILETLAKVGIVNAERHAGPLVPGVTRWIRKHGLRDTAKLVEQLTQQSDPASDGYKQLLGLLIELEPKRAAQVAQIVHAGNPDDDVYSRLALEFDHGEVPLAQIARFYDQVLRDVDLDLAARRDLYRSMPGRASSQADARKLIELLARRTAIESDPSAQRILKAKLEALSGGR